MLLLHFCCLWKKWMQQTDAKRRVRLTSRKKVMDDTRASDCSRSSCTALWIARLPGIRRERERERDYTSQLTFITPTRNSCVLRYFCFWCWATAIYLCFQVKICFQFQVNKFFKFADRIYSYTFIICYVIRIKTMLFLEMHHNFFL